MKPLFSQGPSTTLRLLILAALSITMMVMDHRQQHMENVRSALTIVIYPIQYLINLPAGVGEWLTESLATRQTLIEQNNSLRAQQFLFNTQLQKLDALAAENMRLRALLDSSINASDRVLIAELLSVNMKPFTQQVVISKGSHHDVYRGQPILDASGILGQVVHVSPLNSTAMLITDPSHALPVQVNRNGQRAIAMGTGDTNRLELPHLPNNADIEVGDLLVTSGLGGRFPPGYPAARVTVVSRNPGQPFAEVQAEPTGKLESAREVLLVWHNPPEKVADEAATEAQSTAITEEQTGAIEDSSVEDESIEGPAP